MVFKENTQMFYLNTLKHKLFFLRGGGGLFKSTRVAEAALAFWFKRVMQCRARDKEVK